MQLSLFAHGVKHWLALGALLALLTGSTPLVAADHEPVVKQLIYRHTPQAELKLHVHYPPEWKATDTRAAIVFFFGGGWNAGKVEQFERQATYLASRGMVAARADYRVKTRHGVSPDECVRDAQSAVRYLRQHASELGIDPQRIVASGGSAGGHLAATCGISPPLKSDDANANVSCAANAYVLFNPALNIAAIPQAVERLNHDTALAKQISPTLHLTKQTPPVIMFFGTADALISHGEEFVAAAKPLGVRAELVTTADVGHGFFNKSPYTEQTLLRVDEFLVSLGYLTGKATLKVPE